MTARIPVLLLSPFSGDVQKHIWYAQDAMLESIQRFNEAPFASHLLYPLVLDDTDPAKRETGLACEHVWLPLAKRVVVYTDLGISPGMQRAIDVATELAIPRYMRKLGNVT